jgi:hypothetical protein
VLATLDAAGFPHLAHLARDRGGSLARGLPVATGAADH